MRCSLRIKNRKMSIAVIRHCLWLSLTGWPPSWRSSLADFSRSPHLLVPSACSQCPSKTNFQITVKTRSQNMRRQQNYEQHPATMKEHFPSWPAPTASSLMQSADLVLLPSPGLKKGRPVRLQILTDRLIDSTPIWSAPASCMTRWASPASSALIVFAASKASSTWTLSKAVSNVVQKSSLLSLKRSQSYVRGLKALEMRGKARVFLQFALVQVSTACSSFQHRPLAQQRTAAYAAHGAGCVRFRWGPSLKRFWKNERRLKIFTTNEQK